MLKKKHPASTRTGAILLLSLSVRLSLSCYWHQLRYGEPTLRRAVPLALALISVSNPRLNILDTLSKFSHDADPEVSHNSIFAMGMVGSGESDRKCDLKRFA